MKTSNDPQIELVPVELEIVSLRTDPSAYKKYSPELKPDTKLTVVISVPKKYTSYVGTDKTILTLKGLTTLMKNVAVAIAALENSDD